MSRSKNNMKEEILKKSEYGEFISCICGNDAMDSGFYPCDSLGNEVVPDDKWNGKLYVCFSCGRIVDQFTGIVQSIAMKGAVRL